MRFGPCIVGGTKNTLASCCWCKDVNEDKSFTAVSTTTSLALPVGVCAFGSGVTSAGFPIRLLGTEARGCRPVDTRLLRRPLQRIQCQWLHSSLHQKYQQRNGPSRANSMYILIYWKVVWAREYELMSRGHPHRHSSCRPSQPTIGSLEIWNDDCMFTPAITVQRLQIV